MEHDLVGNDNIFKRKLSFAWKFKSRAQKIAMSGTVGKLRFMQKARDSEPSATIPAMSAESAEKWALSNVDADRLYCAPALDNKLTAISVMARRSYGGANPYIEQQMALLEKSKKRRRA